MKRLLPTLIFAFILLFTPSSALAATLALSPASGTFNKGCSFSVDIKLDTTGAQTDGTDAIIKYDNSKLSATSINSGTIYADYPGNSIDESTGKITTSGLASVSSAFTGSGTLATINFTVKEGASTGATIVSFDFDVNNKTNTTDSNVVQRGTIADILSSVTNGNYTIGSGACANNLTSLPRTGQGQTATGSAGQTTTTTTEVERKTLPDRGTKEVTFAIAIVGSALTVLGILGLALL